MKEVSDIKLETLEDCIEFARHVRMCNDVSYNESIEKIDIKKEIANTQSEIL
jgi:hypothetical protein